MGNSSIPWDPVKSLPQMKSHAVGTLQNHSNPTLLALWHATLLTVRIKTVPRNCLLQKNGLEGHISEISFLYLH